MQTQLQRSKHDPTETRCKLTLLILFLLGAALILGGLWGIRQYQQSGFDQEVGYRYIQKLSGEVDRLYTQSIQPVMAKLTDAEGKERSAACQGGLVTVSGGQVWVMATTFEWADEIDAERAQRARQEAEERLRALDRSDEQFRIAEAKLKRALTRLHVRG